MFPAPEAAPTRAHARARARRSRPTRRAMLMATLAIAFAAVLAPLGGIAPALAADGVGMEAHALLDGHARVGSWLSIAVRLSNDGPAVTGELRMTGGAQGKTRFTTPVDLPPSSDKTYQFYAQPPAFGSDVAVELVSGNRILATRKVALRVHDAGQLVVGIVAEQPQRVVGDIRLLPDARGTSPAIVPLTVDDLPDRIEAWATLDRLVWQDVDTTSLSTEQLAALRGWVAAGGRLVVAAGTTGPAVLSNLPDELLPYRPAVTIDVAPTSLSGLLTDVPRNATDVPALAGELVRGRALATSGDRVIAAETAYGGGGVTLLGVDPGTSWIAGTDAAETMWRRLLPARTNSIAVRGDDSYLVNAVSQLPALALPPTGGLLALLGGYIVLIGPVNYLVLRRLDRREWAWVTMPLLIVLFAGAAYAYGAVLRGLDVIVHEVAVVRGAPNATEGTAQVYLGIFSPTRGTYQVDVPGGALLTSTINGDFMGGAGGALDIVQGDPAQIRDLVVGFGSLRMVRAEKPTTVPQVEADLRLENGTLRGTVRNASQQRLERPAIVLGTSVVVLQDLDPGAQADVSLPVRGNRFGPSVSDRILGTIFYGNPSQLNEQTQRNIVRHSVIDQLTYDPMTGTSVMLDSETPVLLAWGNDPVLDVRIEDQVPRRTGNVLYYVPLGLRIGGPVAFEDDLIRSSVVESDLGAFGKDPAFISFGRGSVTMAYRPIAFDGRLDVSRLTLGMSQNADVTLPVGKPIGPVAPPVPAPAPGATDAPAPAPDCFAPPCNDVVNPDGLAEVELFDRSGDKGGWVRLPHFAMGGAYDVEHPERYVDPATGTVLVRFVNDRQDFVQFAFELRIEGAVR